MKPGLAALAALVHQESGIVVREPQYAALEAALARAHPETSPARFVQLCASPATRPKLVARLLDETTVKETFFLRAARQLADISWPSLLAQARSEGSDRIRVWSAACATGEEPYSLALLACEALGSSQPPVTIVATDISGQALAHARAGEYRARSTRHLDPVQRRKYFHEEGENLVVGDALRALVTFAPNNLVLGPAPPQGQEPFHVILCRNVLIYFDAATVERVIGALERALTPSGEIILGAADALCGRAAPRSIVAESAVVTQPPQKHTRVLRRPFGRALTPDLPPVAPADALEAMLQGLAGLEGNDASAAVVSLRRALYLEPRFGLAAFQLGRAHEALGDRSAARRAYQQALRTFERDDVVGLHDAVLGQVDLDDVIVAVRMRLDALTTAA
jgi:chemotaxis protein methyltransferase CheR